MFAADSKNVDDLHLQKNNQITKIKWQYYW